jgi:hypothetical protein
MDRASGFYPAGWEFESLRRRMNTATPTLDPAVIAILNRIDDAIKEFSGAKLASTDQVVDVLLDIRLHAKEINNG